MYRGRVGTQTKGTIRQVGEYWDAPNPWSSDQPVLRYWCTEGGTTGWNAATGELVGYSLTELREMARQVGTLYERRPA